MSASKKLYEAMAELLNIDIQVSREYPERQQLISYIIRTSIVPPLADDNPDFNRLLFYKACGLSMAGYPLYGRTAEDVRDDYDV